MYSIRMPPTAKIVAGTGTIIAGAQRVLAMYLLKFPIIDAAPHDLREVPVDSITCRLKPDIPVAQTSGLLFEIADRKLRFQFSFVGGHGEIRIEKWINWED